MTIYIYRTMLVFIFRTMASLTNLLIIESSRSALSTHDQPRPTGSPGRQVICRPTSSAASESSAGHWRSMWLPGGWEMLRLIDGKDPIIYRLSMAFNHPKLVVQDFAGPSKIYEFIMEDLICFSWIVGLLNSFRCPAICIGEDAESIINGIPERLVSG